jgi:sarcosine oxidase delta subunit
VKRCLILSSLVATEGDARRRVLGMVDIARREVEGRRIEQWERHQCAGWIRYLRQMLTTEIKKIKHRHVAENGGNSPAKPKQGRPGTEITEGM